VASTPGTLADPVNELIDSLIQLTGRLKRFDPSLASVITQHQAQILHRLRHQSPRRLTSLADELATDLSVISRQATGLVEAGLITRQRDPNDGRAWLIALTPQGDKAIEAFRERRRAWISQVLSTFPTHQIETTTAIVRAISRDLDGDHPTTLPEDQPRRTRPPRRRLLLANRPPRTR